MRTLPAKAPFVVEKPESVLDRKNASLAYTAKSNVLASRELLHSQENIMAPTPSVLFLNSLEAPKSDHEPPVIWYEHLRLHDVPRVGGKNASLGEMTAHLAPLGVKVPGGFATTADAYRRFLATDGLNNRINTLLSGLDVNNIAALTQAGKSIRGWIMENNLPSDLEEAIKQGYAKLSEKGGVPASVAVRSSATAEDLPDASFAGQQETFLNVVGIQNVLQAVKAVFASLFNDRAIAYRQHQGYAHESVALSAGIQYMVRSDLAASGVLFTLDTESGHPDVVMITSSYGLGELVVQGAVDPDEFYAWKPAVRAGNRSVVRRTLGSKQKRMVYSERDAALTPGHSAIALVREEAVDAEDRCKFSLTDSEVEELASIALKIETHYGRPMDIEWAKDGRDKQLYIVQARPETVQSRSDGAVLSRYVITSKESRQTLVTGRSVGNKIGTGKVCVIRDIKEMDILQKGDILVADMTDPDWEPVMKRASAIVTNRGGRTCHAAIISRELGIPAVVGTGNALEVLTSGTEVTVSCAEGDEGYVYAGKVGFEVVETRLDSLPDPGVKLMMNVAQPSKAFGFSRIPNAGVGLMRLEFIIANECGLHPRACLDPSLVDEDTRQTISQRTRAYNSPVEFYISKIAEGISSIAAAFYPKPVIVRMGDFKSNEYSHLIGGKFFEPNEENPMIGFRGAARYIDPSFRKCFSLECQAVRRVREDTGLSNVHVMIPFVRTVREGQAVVDLLKEEGLERGQKDLKIIMMCEIPSNAILADKFLDIFDGFSIGSNDMTQLTLGVDRDSGIVASSFDERDDAVKAMLSMAIRACRARGKYVGICGQGPSDHPDLAEWLLEQNIESMSLNPDTVVETWLALGKVQRRGA